MKKTIVLLSWATGLACSIAAHAQTEIAGTLTQPLSAPPAAPANERARISAERARVEAQFAAQEAMCYKKFLVNNCLEKINPVRREALADLRRQEISLDEQDRKAKGAEQLRKTEDKASPQKQQEAADRRDAALRDFESRMEREKQKNADRATVQSNEKTSSDASVRRIHGNQEKAGARTTKQAAAAEEARKFNERQQKARERQAQHERDQRNQTKPPAKSLPTPE